MLMRCVGILLGLGSLMSACGSDPAEPVTGELELTISTTGQDLDPDGYTVTIDAGSSVAVPVNGTVSIPNLQPGLHTVSLGGLASNCTLTTPAPLEVTLPGAAGAVATMEITCTPVAGTLELTLSTTGHDFDPDGYTVTVDAGSPMAVPTNGKVRFPNLSPGVHALTLAGLASNCALTTPAPLEVTMPGAAGAAATVEISCSAIYTLAYHGSSGVELTDAAGTVHRTLVPEARPLAWSPDGRLLAVSKGKGVWLASVEDGGLSPFITDTSLPGSFFGFQGATVGAWSPDGRDLLLEHPQSFSAHSHPQYLTRFPLDRSYSPQGILGVPDPIGCRDGLRGYTWPAWSPDGNQIVANACSTPGSGSRVYVLSPDGSTRRLLVDGRQPDWSPDGSAIVYVAGPYYRIAPLHVIHPDGSHDRQLTAPAVKETDQDPAWSPDGSKVAFVRLGLASDTVVASVHAYVVNGDGTSERQLAVLPDNSSNWYEVPYLFHPAWSPDGLHLVYSGHGGTYVVNADGSGFRLVSDAEASVPALWRP